MLGLEIETRQSLQERIPRLPIDGRLLRDPRETGLDVGKATPQDREDIRPDPGSEVLRITVRRIGPEGPADSLQMAGQIVPPERQEGSDELAPAAGHRGESCRARAPERSHQDGLRLIVGVVGGGDEARSGLASHRLEDAIAGRTRRGFRCVRAEGQAPRNEGKPVFRSEGPDDLRHLHAVGMDPVIDVGDGKLEAERLPRGDEQIQQGYGVGAAGDGDQEVRRRDVERDKMLSKPDAERSITLHHRGATHLPNISHRH